MYVYVMKAFAAPPRGREKTHVRVWKEKRVRGSPHGVKTGLMCK